ncbi:MAG: TIR domain-containing protein [Oscillibacter sp.]|nr:TIR domain-containing protein [Oscillibacter sp.]
MKFLLRFSRKRDKIGRTGKGREAVQIFISWSKSVSHEIGQALYEWLPTVNPSWKTYISDDLEAGSVWFPELMKRLKTANIALLCVTRENLDSPWLLFEAGAFLIREIPVVPILFRVKSSELENSPLHYLQSVELSEGGIRRLLGICGDGLSTEDTSKTFAETYPELEAKIRAIRVPPEWDKMMPANRLYLTDIKVIPN